MPTHIVKKPSHASLWFSVNPFRGSLRSWWGEWSVSGAPTSW